MRHLVAALFLLTACRPQERVDDIVTEVSLARVESCDELEALLEEDAVDALDAQIDARLEKGFIEPPILDPVRAPTLVGSAPFSPIIATAERLFVLNDGVIRAIGVRPLQQLASAAIEGEPLGIIPAGDRLFVLTEVGDRTRVTLLAQADLALIRAIDLAGTPRAAFPSSDRLTLVLSGGLAAPPAVTEGITALEDESFKIDREGEIRDRTLDDWIERDDLARDCTAFRYIPDAPVDLDLTRIVELDAEDLRAGVQTLIGKSSVAASGDGALLIAVPHRWRLLRPGQVEHSYLLALADGELLAAGGADGDPQPEAIEVSRGSIRMITAIDRRVSDPINTWGRVSRSHRVERYDVDAGRLVLHSASPEFAQDRSLRSVRLLGSRALAATSDRLYAFDLEHLAAPVEHPLDRPIDRLAEAGGSLIAATAREGELEISLLDPAALGRALSSRVVPMVLPDADLAFSIDPAGRIAVPEIGVPEPDFPQTPSVAVRVLSVDGGALISSASIELSLLHAERSAPPHLVYGMFVAGQALALSDAGVAALGQAANGLAIESILFQ